MSYEHLWVGLFCVGFIVLFFRGLFKIVLFLAILIGAFYALSAHAMDEQRVRALYSHLENISGYHVILKIAKDDEINAYTTPYKIVVFTGLINYATMDDDIVAVIGHELGHWINKDPRQSKDIEFYELRADVFGDRFCRQLGYKHCLHYMYQMQKLFGDNGDPDNNPHPRWSIRIQNVLDHRPHKYKYYSPYKVYEQYIINHALIVGLFIIEPYRTSINYGLNNLLRSI